MMRTLDFGAFLKQELVHLVDSYRNLFRKTYGIATTLTIFILVGVLYLMKYTDPTETSSKHLPSLVSYLYFRHSTLVQYCITDLSKIFFTFFVAVYSLMIHKHANEESISFATGVKNLGADEIIF